jgi:hypothetical protein
MEHNMKTLSDNQIVNHIDDINIIDNFFTEECMLALRYRTIFSNHFDKKYENYFALHHYPGEDYLSDLIVKELPQKVDLPKFQRGWTFVYLHNNVKGVDLHCDPSIVNMNVWISSDESVSDIHKNGINIYKVLPPSDWNRQDWNSNSNKSREFVKSKNVKPIKIPYKSNRAVFFNGAYFHETNDISMKPGIENMRVSYTLLFGQNLE